MNYLSFLKHDIKDSHAYLSPSKASWINYDPQKLVDGYAISYATQIGTAVHECASNCIKRRIRLNKTDKKVLVYHMMTNTYIPSSCYDVDRIFATLSLFVNDCIGFRMQSEVPLVYSGYAFGTTDAISYDIDNRVLRIFDLKSGTRMAKPDQLYIYAGLFCLEYKMNPEEMSEIVLRIYQGGAYEEFCPAPEVIRATMDTIIKDNDILVAEYGERKAG